MFEVGQKYHFRVIEEGDETTGLGEVLAIDGPLIKVMWGGRETIMNTTSSLFVSAALPREPVTGLYATPAPPIAIGEDGWPKKE